jgi:hypothetical protein
MCLRPGQLVRSLSLSLVHCAGSVVGSNRGDPTAPFVLTYPLDDVIAKREDLRQAVATGWKSVRDASVASGADAAGATNGPVGGSV